MYAVIQASGRQYRVSEGDVISLQRMPGKPGEEVEFSRVLLLEKDGTVQAGDAVKSAKVTGKIVGDSTSRKIRVYHFRKHKNTQKTRGHRAMLTRVAIEKIVG